jgi:uncharacterized membrane protein YphA (DoxX/SURF4 family)
MQVLQDSGIRSRIRLSILGSGEVLLQLLFSAFPGGLPGISLLLLRAVLGIAMVIDGGSYVVESHPTLAAWSLGLPALASGALLVIGLFTPFVGLVVGLNIVGVALSMLPASTPNMFDSHPALVFALTILLAIIGAGPGRYSVDARVFGRREIIIPLPQSPLHR